MLGIFRRSLTPESVQSAEQLVRRPCSRCSGLDFTSEDLPVRFGSCGFVACCSVRRRRERQPVTGLNLMGCVSHLVEIVRRCDLHPVLAGERDHEVHVITGVFHRYLPAPLAGTGGC